MYTTLYLTITNECQLRCPHCYKEDYGESLLHFEDIEKTLDKYPSIEIVVLYGGEPLLSKYSYYVKDVIKYLKSRHKVVICVSNLTYRELSDCQMDILKSVDSLSTSWNPTRFNETTIQYWRNNLDIVSKFKDIQLLVTLDNSLIQTNVKEVYEFLETLPVATIKFEPYIGYGQLKPKNRDVDLWLNSFFEICHNKRKYTLFDDIMYSIENNTRLGIFWRNCDRSILTLYPNGDLCGCPNSKYKIENQKKFSYLMKNFNSDCIKCKYFKFCSGSCPLLSFDETGCVGYPVLFESILKCINNSK